MSISFSGLSSGIDSKAIIESLIAVQTSQVDRIKTDKQIVTNRRSALSEVRNRVEAFRGSLSTLTRSAGGAFDTRVATSSDEDILSVAASSRSAPGVHTLRVLSLATNHQVASQSFSAPGAEITQGTLTISTGSNATTDITIDGSNNTLEGLATAINNARVGVTASVVGVGGGSYRLLLSSDETGTNSQINITNNLAATAGDVIKPDFTGTAVQVAADAQVRLGSGAGAITVTSSSNRFNDLIPGVAIDLKTANVDKDVVVNVAADVDAIAEGVQGFVDGYNNLIKYIRQATAVNGETGQASILTGERLVSQLESELSGVMTNAVAGGHAKANRLSAIGVTFQDDGSLAFDESKLRELLTPSNENDVTVADVKKLFAFSGVSTNNGLQFVLGGNSTKGGEYEVNITTAAEQAQVTATSALAGSTVINNTNNKISIKINNDQYTDLVIDSGTYTQAELASKVQETINEAFGQPGGLVIVSASGGSLKITTNNFGNTAKIENIAGTATTALGFGGSESDTGVDVAGHFLVDGEIEEAEGSGRLLTGKSGNANTDGLQIRASLTASQIGGANEGTMTIHEGMGTKLGSAIGNLLDDRPSLLDPTKFVDSPFNAGDKALKTREAGFDTRIERLNSLVESQQARLEAQFARLESALAQLNTQTQTITAAFAQRR